MAASIILTSEDAALKAVGLEAYRDKLVRRAARGAVQWTLRLQAASVGFSFDWPTSASPPSY